MNPVNFLKRLRQDQRGNILVVGVATMPILIGSAGLAVDTIQLTLWKQQLQRTADSGAIAGAYAYGQGAEADQIEQSVENDLDENERPTLVMTSVTPGAMNGHSRAVRVQLSSQRTLPFMNFFNPGPTSISAEATAALVTEGEYCMVSLYDGTDTGIDVNGNADISLGCGMATNARGTSAITSGGASSISATPLAAVGGLDGDSNNFDGDTTLQPYSAPQPDPFASIANPSVGSMDCSEALNVSPNQTVNISAGVTGKRCFSSITLKGNVTFGPGTYYVNGGNIDFTAQANVTGAGVTFVMTGINGAAGDLKINGGADLTLSSPDSGEYKGVLFYRDRRASNIEIKINGGADMAFTGAMYMPSSDITLTGAAGMDVDCLQMVGQKLKFRGNASISNECPANSGADSFRQVVVRLVA